MNSEWGYGARGSSVIDHVPAPNRPLKATQVRFIEVYLVTLNATSAYRAAHPLATSNTARNEGAKYLANPCIAAELARRQREITERTNVTVDKLVTELWKIVCANPNELVSWRVGCCRHCHGFEFKYQRTDFEFADDKQRFEEHGMEPKRNCSRKEEDGGYDREMERRFVWDPKGGGGFDARRDPHEACPGCFGEGQGRLVRGDTSKLSPQARALFAGVKQTKESFEILMHDKMAAMDKLLRHLGGYERDNKQQGTGDLAALLAQFTISVALPVVACPSDDREPDRLGP